MAVTVSGTSITFNDATVQTTAASPAPASTFGVGAVIIATKTSGGTATTSAGETIAGSSLRIPSGPSGSTSNGQPVTTGSTSFYYYNPSLSGTWRASMPCGSGNSIFGDPDQRINTLWTRIS
jgi:hypothetical protein